MKTGKRLRISVPLAFRPHNSHIARVLRPIRRFRTSFAPAHMPDRARNIHERFLRHIWSRQYLDAPRLRTSDGRLLQVLQVGTLNLDGGPDFAGARIRIGATTYVGDVEIHRTISDWFSHQHQNDPRYNGVILHVVLEGSSQRIATTSLSGRTIPVLVLSEFLTESIQSIWQKTILDERARRLYRIRCFDRNHNVSDAVLSGWLRKLATERVELKMRRFEERLKDLAYERLMAVREHPKTYGEPPVEGFPDEIPPPFKELTQKDFSKKELWDQILYEGLMEGLGYAKNQEPFRRLASSVTLQRLRDLQLIDDDHRRAALLFAVAGLIPTIKSVREHESKKYVRSLLRSWNEMRSSIHTEKLRASDWQLFPTRPNNVPTLRISAANLLIRRIVKDNLFREVIQTLKRADEPERSFTTLVRLLSVQTDEFWQRHYDFDRPVKKAVVALGLPRISELLVNTIVPISLLYARIFKDSRVREHTIHFYESFPPVNLNSVTRLMQEQLLRNRFRLDSASKQQALIQLYRFYCTESRCNDCEVGRTIVQLD